MLKEVPLFNIDKIFNLQNFELFYYSKKFLVYVCHQITLLDCASKSMSEVMYAHITFKTQNCRISYSASCMIYSLVDCSSAYMIPFKSRKFSTANTTVKNLNIERF